MILKGFIALMIFFIVPELIGLLILKFFKEEKNNLFLGLIIGMFVMFSVFQLVSVPAIYAEMTFSSLIKILIGIFGVLSILSILLNIKNTKEIFIKTFKYIKEMPKLHFLICLVLIGLQIYAYVAYAHIDDDDAVYIGTATVTVETDTLYKYSASTGGENMENQISRYRLGPFPIYNAFVSKLIDMHPAIVGHVVMPSIFVVITYLIYGLIGNELFKKDSKLTYTFLMLMCVINIFGYYSGRSNFTFLLIRGWQGKSVLANMILPAIILLFMKAEKNNYELKYCLLLFITVLAGTFTTTMGVAMPPIELMLLAVIYEVAQINFKRLKDGSRDEKKNIVIRIKNIAKCLVCCIPSIVYGIAYLVI